MPVVRREGVQHSRKLNACSLEAHIAYAAFVATVPDDFGRFRISVSSIAEAMCPRREQDRKQLEKKLRTWLPEWEAADLFHAWEVDGVRFAELTGWTPTGNLTHKTPEPQFSTHVHNGRCMNGAKAQARMWGTPLDSEQPSLPVNDIPIRETDGKATGGGTEPVPSSYSSYSTETDSPPAPPLPRGGGSQPGRPGVAAAVARLERRARELDVPHGRGERKLWRRRLLAGELEPDLLRELDQRGAEISGSRGQAAAEEAQYRAEREAALAWITDHGGPDVVARSIAEWVGRSKGPEEKLLAALERWAAADDVPHLVVTELLSRVLVAIRKVEAA